MRHLATAACLLGLLATGCARMAPRPVTSPADEKWAVGVVLTDGAADGVGAWVTRDTGPVTLFGKLSRLKASAYVPYLGRELSASGLVYEIGVGWRF